MQHANWGLGVGLLNCFLKETVLLSRSQNKYDVCISLTSLTV